MSAFDHLEIGSGSKGVRVNRRRLFRGALAGSLVMGLHAIARAQVSGQVKLDEFFESWSERARLLLAADEPNEEAWLHELGAALARVKPEKFPRKNAVVFDEGGLRTGPVFAGSGLLVLEVELDPGAVIPAHNHVGFDFLTLGITGEARVRHFEPEPDAPDPTQEDVTFLIREVSSSVLVPGRTSSLTRTRGNIHAFAAGEGGARMLDFGVKFSKPGDGPKTFSVLDVGDDPVDSARRIHEARWLGDIYKK